MNSLIDVLEKLARSMAWIAVATLLLRIAALIS